MAEAVAEADLCDGDCGCYTWSRYYRQLLVVLLAVHRSFGSLLTATGGTAASISSAGQGGTGAGNANLRKFFTATGGSWWWYVWGRWWWRRWWWRRWRRDLVAAAVLGRPMELVEMAVVVITVAALVVAAVVVVVAAVHRLVAAVFLGNAGAVVEVLQRKMLAVLVAVDLEVMDQVIPDI
jgi:hypothetical protein